MKTLVLIDSDALTRTLISECLTGKDWCVLEAEDGQAGLDLVLKHHPTAVICDLRTPKRNGFQGLPHDSRAGLAQRNSRHPHDGEPICQRPRNRLRYRSG